MSDNKEALDHIAKAFAQLPRLRSNIGSASLTPERVLRDLADNIVGEKEHAWMCLGYGKPHMWAENANQASKIARMDDDVFEKFCAEHPERRDSTRNRREGYF